MGIQDYSSESKLMLMDLDAAVYIQLKYLIQQLDVWESVAVRYEEPYVDRIYTNIATSRGFCRLNLHKIYPISDNGTALFHPHNWKAAMKVFGNYRMLLGVGTARENVELCAEINLTRGSSYTMLTPNSWHSVTPLDSIPTYTIMLTYPPFQNNKIWADFKETLNIQPQESLDDNKKKLLINEFSSLLFSI